MQETWYVTPKAVMTHRLRTTDLGEIMNRKCSYSSRKVSELAFCDMANHGLAHVYKHIWQTHNIVDVTESTLFTRQQRVKYSLPRDVTCLSLPRNFSKIWGFFQNFLFILKYGWVPIIKIFKCGWRDGLVVKDTGCSSRGPGYSSQHWYSDSQSPVTPGPGNLIPSSEFHNQHAHMWYTGIYAGKMFLCVKYINLSKRTFNK